MKVLLLQLPIPPFGPEAVRGNVPLAAAYLKLYAQRVARVAAEIELLPSSLSDGSGDAAMVREIADRRPDVLGLSCYLWNIERSLFLAQQVKQLLPNVRVVLGGPEITPDNAWVLEHPAVDYAVMGEGEQTFAELLGYLTETRGGNVEEPVIAGLWSRRTRKIPPRRGQLPHLNDVGRVYLEGILDPAPYDSLLLETVRGCVFKCGFCYYPKSFDRLAYMDAELAAANLAAARRSGVSEVVLLDPTLNQRRDFTQFLRLLVAGNADRSFTYSAELRAEGVRAEHARLMAEAGFAEVELGLQSVDPTAQALMHRTVNLPAFERGVRAMLEAGIRTRVDLIVGLPGDTADSVRRGFDYLARSRLYSEIQIFRLAVLPGTDFRRRHRELGLEFQPHPPYHVLRTPTLSSEEIGDLMREAESLFGTEFDPLPEVPSSASCDSMGLGDTSRDGTQWVIDLDASPRRLSPDEVGLAHVLRFLSRDFPRHGAAMRRWVEFVLEHNPHCTLWIVIELGEGGELPRER
ncbi:MAG: radical SAM protein, partial [Thermogutta sp.]|nr:radical SAM protein [Thermogutta sp.]